MIKSCMVQSAIRCSRPRWLALALAAALSGLGPIEQPFAADPPLTIEHLLTEGWEIAGYAGTLDNRSALILFRNKDKKYLVQCSTLYDVTRSSRITLNCYELH